MDHSLIIRDCRPYDLATDKQSVDIMVKDRVISHIGRIEARAEHHHVLDAGDRLLIPGLIDVHVHGAGGGDTSHGSVKALQTISTTLARFGITSFLATTMTRPETGNKHLRIAGEQVGQDLGGANLLGLHLEGPFISSRRRGGIPLTAIEQPSPEALERLVGLTEGTLSMMTIAPEVDGALDVIPALVNQGIVASFGHSDADYHETQQGIAAGLSHVTHTFNAMRPIHHRDPGPVPAIFDASNVTVQLISDGIHLHEKMVRYIYKQFGRERCICISDGMQAMGLPEGKYSYYGQEFESEGGAARYLDGTLIGTTCSLHQMMIRFMGFVDCSLPAAVDTVTINPARALNINDRKGAIEVGKDADLVVLDDDYSVWATIIGGRIVYKK
ncbi:N-acetylglucosamine-6-phosphate deacetylase [Candidatus Neomarinimicrobiota bacterium]